MYQSPPNQPPNQPQGYPPQQQAYPPQQTAYPPQQTAWQQPLQQPWQQTMQQGYPPQQQAYPPQQQAYPPQQTMQQPYQQSAPPQPRRRPPRRKLNPFQLVVILAALAVCGWYLYTAFAPEAATTAVIRAGTLGARYSGDCLIVRNETPYDAEGVTSVTYIAEEGAVVQRGAKICQVFASGFSSRELRTLQDFRDQIRDYQREIIGKETTYDVKMVNVESDVVARAKEVRAMIAGTRGNMANQEKLLAAAIQARQDYIEDKYATDQRLSRLYADEAAQMQRIDSWTKLFVATGESLVSFYSDGYEYGLTSANYDSFTPAEVRDMYNGRKPEKTTIQKGKTTVYRTIRDGEWHVLFLVDDTSWTPVDGGTYELKLERFENTTVNARVDSSARLGGELLVRLTVKDSVLPVLYMRTCKAELGDYVATLCVPARAIKRMDDTDGVLVIDQDTNTQSFIPVNIVYRDGDDVYVSPVQQGPLREGMTVALF